MKVVAMALLAQGVSLSADTYGVDVVMSVPRTRPAWRDDFSGAGVDPAKWRFDTARNATGWPNHERQYYAADRPENARIAGGALVIEARRERLSQWRDWGGQRYSSAKLVSRRALGYGFYEIRARLPCGRGTWPAVWLLPARGAWPAAGEIDIVEMVGWQPDFVHATVHSALYNHRIGTQRGAERAVPNACGAFHRYQLDWRPESITIGVDGRGYMRVADDRPGAAGAWPFTRPYQLILNLAVGGDWGGAKGIDDSAWPQRMTIDYVRYWRSGAR